MGIAMIVREGNACDFVPPGDSRALVNALRPCVDNASYLAEVGERAVALPIGQMDPDNIANIREYTTTRSSLSHQRRMIMCRKRIETNSSRG